MDCSRRMFLGGLSAVPMCGCTGFFGAAQAPARRLAPSARVNLALIGCGTQGKGNLSLFLQDPRVRVTCVCDPVTDLRTLYGYKAQNAGGCLPFKETVEAAYKATGCRWTNDWREVVADPAIDAVVVATPDHWHALISIAAMRAGKHVFCQKPLALSIEEGIVMTRVAKESGVTFQVGKQGRSNATRRTASEIIRNGVLGKARACRVGLPGGSGGHWGHGVDTTRKPIPAWFTPATWDLWQGPAAHWENNAYIPGIHEPMAWRWNKRYGGGMITDFTPHEVDTMHWAMDFERTGPVALENFTAAEFQADRGVFSWPGSFSYDLRYATGFTAHVMSLRPGVPRGLLYDCENGSLALYGEKIEVKDKTGKDITKETLRAWRHAYRSDTRITRLYAPKDGHSHEMDFIDGIFEARQVCSECEFGHRTLTTAHLANICVRTGRTALAWDPVSERFADPALAPYLKADYANGWRLDA